MDRKLLKSKTFWVGVTGVVTAVGGYMTGEMSLGVAVQTGIGSLAAIFLRDSLAKLANFPS